MKYFLSFSLLLILGILFLSCQDSVVEPENQFVKIYLKYDHKNVLNTFDNTYQKDLVLDGTITVNFWLTADEQNQILNKANEINFFTFPESFETDSSLPIPSENFGQQKLRIKFNDINNTVVWYYPLYDNDQQVKDLMAIEDLIRSIIEAKPEYKKLPEGRGGYL